MRVITFLIVFLFFGAFFIISNDNLHLKDKLQRDKFLGLYYSWLDSIIGNFKTITGYVVSVNWIPKETVHLNSSK